MNFFDSHTHLPCYNPDEIQHIVSETPQDWLQIVGMKSETIFTSIAIHPWCISHDDSTLLFQLETILKENSTVNVGEIGLDFTKGKPPKEDQLIRFEEQLKLAIRLNRLVTIHSVRSWGEIIATLHKTGVPERGIIFHGFRGSKEILNTLLSFNCYFSVGVREVKNAGKIQRNALLSIPLNRLLLETDGRSDSEILLEYLTDLLKISGDKISNHNNTLFRKLFSSSR